MLSLFPRVQYNKALLYPWEHNIVNIYILSPGPKNDAPCEFFRIYITHFKNLSNFLQSLYEHLNFELSKSLRSTSQARIKPLRTRGDPISKFAVNWCREFPQRKKKKEKKARCYCILSTISGIIQKILYPVAKYYFWLL